MKKIDDSYEVKLNFIDEFNLSRNGMLNEIKTEFDIIRLCFQEQGRLDKTYEPMLNRILVMPLRKLLCENNSVLLQVCPDFKMPHLKGYPIKPLNEQVIVRPPFNVEPQEAWIPVEEWLKQEISWFDRKAEDIVKILPKHSYEAILKRLNGKNVRHLKSRFESLYYSDEAEYKGKDFYRYTRIVGSGTAGNKNHFFQRRCIFCLYRSGPCSKI